MKSDLECLVCLLKQALNTAKIATEDKTLHRKVLDRVAEQIQRSNLELSPALVSKPVYDIVSEVTGVKDPYKDLKHQTNLEALRLLPELEKIVARANVPLDAALHLAVAGNIIDVGIGHAFDLKNDVQAIMRTKFTIDHTDVFKRELQSGGKLLFLGDNSGEIVFDRVLIQELLKRGIEVTFCVKSGPIINDAILEDAKFAGITDLVRVIETGSNDIGVNFDLVSDEFRKVFEAADLLLAKGHGNFETCSNLPYNIYFLLIAKCNVVAQELGVKTGEIVFKHQQKSISK